MAEEIKNQYMIKGRFIHCAGRTMPIEQEFEACDEEGARNLAIEKGIIVESIVRSYSPKNSLNSRL